MHGCAVTRLGLAPLPERGHTWVPIGGWGNAHGVGGPAPWVACCLAQATEMWSGGLNSLHGTPDRPDDQPHGSGAAGALELWEWGAMT